MNSLSRDNGCIIASDCSSFIKPRESIEDHHQMQEHFIHFICYITLSVHLCQTAPPYIAG